MVPEGLLGALKDEVWVLLGRRWGPGFAQPQTLTAGPCPPVPPQLLVADGSGQVTALVGQPLELFCQASGSPMPTLQCVWGGGGQGWGAGRQRPHAAGSVGMGGTPCQGV